jgi:hypothetical protein
MGRKKKINNYWTDETEKAVADYQLAEGDRERNRIFNNHLHVPFKKISEIYCNSIDTGYTGEDKEDLINDCLTHLITSSIRTFKPSAGKAYSYFSVSAKYWVMQKNMKGYTDFKRSTNFQGLEGVDGEDETFEINSYSTMFIERYYAFINWFVMHLPNIYYSKTVKKHMWWVLEFMENGLDVVDDYLKIRVAEKFKEMFPESKDTMTRFARVHVYEQYLHFIKEWDKGIVNPTPIIPGPIDYVNRKTPSIKELSGGGVPKYKRNYDRYRGKKPQY